MNRISRYGVASLASSTFVLVGCTNPVSDTNVEEIPVTFQLGGEDTEDLGTFVDDRGNFEVDTNAEGIVSQIEITDTPGGTNDGTVTIEQLAEPSARSAAQSAGHRLTINPANWRGSIIIELDGQTGRLIISDDPVIEALFGLTGEFVIEFSTSDVFRSFQATGRIAAQSGSTCSTNEFLISTACDIAGDLDVSVLSNLLIAQFEASGFDSSTATSANIENMLNKYLGLILTFCEVWDEFVESGGSLCGV